MNFINSIWIFRFWLIQDFFLVIFVFICKLTRKQQNNKIWNCFPGDLCHLCSFRARHWSLQFIIALKPEFLCIPAQNSIICAIANKKILFWIHFLFSLSWYYWFQELSAVINFTDLASKLLNIYTWWGYIQIEFIERGY